MMGSQSSIRKLPIPIDFHKIGIFFAVSVTALICLPFYLHFFISAAYLAKLFIGGWLNDIGQPDQSTKARPKPLCDLNKKTPRVIVIGSGYAGLNAASTLHAEGIPYIVLERAADAGFSWANRYSRLHLHTPKSISNVVHFPIPEFFPEFIHKNDVVRYLNSVAQLLHVQFNSEVSKVEFDNSKRLWMVTYINAEKKPITIEAPAVVLATGKEYIGKRIPKIPGMDQFKGTIIHSQDYSSGSIFTGRRVMVVGAGNTGTELAIDLVENNAVEVVNLVRSPIHINPRWMLRLVQKLYGFAWPLLRVLDPAGSDLLATKVLYPLLYADLQQYKLKLREGDGPVVHFLKTHKTPIIDIGWINLVRARKIQIEDAEIAAFTTDGVRLQNGLERQLDVVVFATGYEVEANFGRYLEEGAAKAISAQGPLVESGSEVQGTRGLYLIGWSDFLGRIFETQIEATIVVRDMRKKGYV